MGKQDIVYSMVTERIVAQLEQGVVPWRKPWCGSSPAFAYNYTSGRKYALYNQWLLLHGPLHDDPEHGYITPHALFKNGGKPKPGADFEIVFGWIVRPEQVLDKAGQPVVDDDGKPVTRNHISLKYDRVFWVGDTEGLPKKEAPVSDHEECPEAADVIADYITRSGVTFIDNTPSGSAYYRPSTDTVVVPMLNQFAHREEYYSTAFHELTHSTGHKSRLNRLENGRAAAFGSEVYSKEELVAEIGAATLVNACGLETGKSFTNSTAYIKSWLKALKDDVRLLVGASARAEKAVKLILNK